MVVLMASLSHCGAVPSSCFCGQLLVLLRKRSAMYKLLEKSNFHFMNTPY